MPLRSTLPRARGHSPCQSRRRQARPTARSTFSRSREGSAHSRHDHASRLCSIAVDMPGEMSLRATARIAPAAIAVAYVRQRVRSNGSSAAPRRSVRRQAVPRKSSSARWASARSPVSGGLGVCRRQRRSGLELGRMPSALRAVRSQHRRLHHRDTLPTQRRATAGPRSRLAAAAASYDRSGACAT